MASDPFAFEEDVAPAAPVDPNNITPPGSLPDAEPDGGRSRGTPGVRR